MRIILSRKGFDSENGCQASPIMPDGTLLSFPIPSNDSTLYQDIFYKDKTYFDIIKELNQSTKLKPNSGCHLDPDINYYCINRSNDWTGIFGQAEAAQGHLQNNKITMNDIFLFFGWFKETELVHGKLQYKAEARDLHIIFGYLQIGNIYKDNFPDWTKYHPHAKFKSVKNNCLYTASEKLSFESNLPGYGIFKFNKKLVLTKDNETRSRWDLPEYFKKVKISYHNESSFMNGYFDSAKKGQEFIIESNSDVSNWAKEIIKTGYIASTNLRTNR